MSLLDLMPVLIFAFGIYMLIRLRFFFILHPIRTVRKFASGLRRKSARRSLSLALAGTLGVGNIIGIAYGISKVGAGCLFWIFVSSVFSSVIKYSESILAADRSGEGRGMMRVIDASFVGVGGRLGKVYAALCLLLSFSMGSALQSQSSVQLLPESLGIPSYVFSAAFTALVAVVVVGGVRKIENATEIIIPLSTIIYTIMCLAVIIVNISSLPSVMYRIVSEAFEIKSIGSGVGAFVSMSVLREGFARGLLSNEAGAGTSAMAQSRADADCAEVGLLGLSEVFFDTVVLCMLTGIAILVSGVPTEGLSGARIVADALSSVLGGGAATVLFILVLFFAYSTVICWFYYGSECVSYLFGKRMSSVFIVIFLFFSFIGFIIPTGILISVTDYILFFMTVITLAALLKNSGRIVYLSELNGLLKNSDMR